MRPPSVNRQLAPAIAAMLTALSARADTPNIFNPNEMSSEAIVTGVLSCEKVAREKDPQLDQLLVIIYCGCTMDAMRFNVGRKLKDPTPTAAQIKRCAARAQERGREAQAQRAPNPQVPPTSSNESVNAAPQQVLAVKTGATVTIEAARYQEALGTGDFAPIVQNEVIVREASGAYAYIKVADAKQAIARGARIVTGRELDQARAALTPLAVAREQEAAHANPRSPDGSGSTYLYDRETKAVIKVRDEEVTRLVASGRYGLPRGGVQVRGPLGERGTILADEAQQAFSQGYSYVTSAELEKERKEKEDADSWWPK